MKTISCGFIAKAAKKGITAPNSQKRFGYARKGVSRIARNDLTI